MYKRWKWGFSEIIIGGFILLSARATAQSEFKGLERLKTSLIQDLRYLCPSLSVTPRHITI
jgi:hypothetical protein